MPDDLPDGSGLDDLTLDELVQLRDKAHARAERLDALAGKLDDLIAEHEDRRADREADRRRAAFRIITGGGALLTVLGWIFRKLGHLAQANPAVAAGTALGAATLAGGAALAVVHLEPGGPGGGQGLLSQPPAVSGRPTSRTLPPFPGHTAPPRTSPGRPSEPNGTPAEGASTPPPGSPAGPPVELPIGGSAATPAPSESGVRPGQEVQPTGLPTGLPIEPSMSPPVRPPSEPSVEPSEPAATQCILGVDLAPLLGVCALGQT